MIRQVAMSVLVYRMHSNTLNYRFTNHMFSIELESQFNKRDTAKQRFSQKFSSSMPNS